jgi:hypothetical protein
MFLRKTMKRQKILDKNEFCVFGIFPLNSFLVSVHFLN